LSLFAHWEKNADSLQDIVAFNFLVEQLREEGLDDLVQLATSWSNSADHLTALIQEARYRALLDEVLSTRRALAGFDAETHERTIEQFCALDRAYPELIRRRALQRRPDLTKSDRVDHARALRALAQELAEPPRRSLRELAVEAGPALQEAKPIFLMTPASVAMLLADASLFFDLVVFDDASRIRAGDALGAVARGGQVVACGDSRQGGVAQAVEALVEENARSAGSEDSESLVDLMRARGAREHLLRWQYGARPALLTRWVDAEVYGRRIFRFPGVEEASGQSGASLQIVPAPNLDENGREREAALIPTMVDAVLQHIIDEPARSIGVVVFSERDLKPVLHAFERARRKDHTYEAYFKAQRHEPFYIKTLEQAQGDVRDSVFLVASFQRSRTPAASPESIGALAPRKVQRDLAVFCSLARYGCRIFTDTDVDRLERMGEAEPGLSVVARLFRTLEKGVAPADRMVAASELERVVAEAVRGAGFDVVQGIGGSGMRVDLAVLEPGGRCVLGILCDGIEYGSAPAARDRDRLRPHLLMTRGWRIHRVWSVEWFRNPERELQRILAVIEETRADRATLIKAPRPLPSNGAKTAFKEPD
jgi:hypothetical protein